VRLDVTRWSEPGAPYELTWLGGLWAHRAVWRVVSGDSRMSLSALEGSPRPTVDGRSWPPRFAGIAGRGATTDGRESPT
jgi:hypothetical protein